MNDATAWGEVGKIFLKELLVFQKMCQELLPKSHWWLKVQTLFEQTGTKVTNSRANRPALGPFALNQLTYDTKTSPVRKYH